ncbi:MAG: thiamine phosphate synthase [Leptospiraceae bacterium]|nr:thiamine phosphate synthase [Leptospiraceae bacterium]
MRLYPILDEEFCQKNSIDPIQLLEFWFSKPEYVRFVQYRAKNINEKDYGKKLGSFLKHFPKEKFIINDHWKVGEELGAYGIHLGKEDFLSFTEKERERFFASSLLKGTSSHSLEDLEIIKKYPWDYTGYGPIFPTTSKKTENKVIGIEGLRKAIKNTEITLVAIGGIDETNAIEIYNTTNVVIASISLFSSIDKFSKLIELIKKT